MAARRTAFGSFGGSLITKTCTDLAEHASVACIADSKLPPAAIDSVIFGNIVQVS